MMLFLFRKGSEATTEDAPVDAGVNDVVSCQVRLGSAPGDAAVNDVVPYQARVRACPWSCCCE